jgi:hypothetical protein
VIGSGGTGKGKVFRGVDWEVRQLKVENANLRARLSKIETILGLNQSKISGASG